MKAIYLDTFAGISGNMFLGALLDAGFPFEVLEQELKKLNLGAYELVYLNANKLGIEAKYFNVLLPEEHEHAHHYDHDHEHDHHHHEHEHGYHHEHDNEHEYGHHHEHEQNYEHEHEYDHEHEHYHEHEHNHEHSHNHNNSCTNEPMDVAEISEHNSDHVHTGELYAHHHNEDGHVPEHSHEHDHDHEHGHHHEHEHCHGQHHEHHHEHEHSTLPHTHHHHEHRNLRDIMSIINASSLSEGVKQKAEAVFRAIAVAEGKVHGKPLDEVHFHEVGAIDTIIDIVGTLIGLEYLGIEKIYVGPIVTGYGSVMCAHGLMPVPAPATAEILQGMPQSKGIVPKEMTTPTGAALMKVLATVSLELPEGFTSEKIAYGAGTRDVAIPNVLRMYIGQENAAAHDIVVAACNLDDISGEVLAYAMDRLREAGALDVWAEPIVMKKTRPAYKLCLLAYAEKLDELLEIVFEETTTLGVRYHKVCRQELERSFVTVKLPEGEIKVKCGSYKGRVVNLAPEYEDCARAAAASGSSLAAIMNEAREAAEASL